MAEYTRSDFPSLASQFAAVIERLSEVWRSFLIDIAKRYRLSPLQLQILWVLERASTEKERTVSAIAQYLGMQNATVSDSVRVLREKGYVAAYSWAEDLRVQICSLTAEGKALLNRLPRFEEVLESAVASIPPAQQAQTYETLLQLIAHLQRQGVIRIQRMCFNCAFYRHNVRGVPHYCTLLEQPLTVQELRLHCPEYQDVAASAVEEKT